MKYRAEGINRHDDVNSSHSRQLARSSPHGGTLERQLEEVAHQINEICRRGTFDLAYEIGALIVRRIFGDLNAWSRYGTSHPSYRQLARRGDLLMSPSGLCRSVGVYSMCERFGGRGIWQHLSASHLQEVLPLDVPEQDRLLHAAEAERWTVSRLRAEVRKCRGNKEPAPSLHRDVRRVNSLLEKAHSVISAATSLATLSDDDASELREALRLTRERCMQLHETINQVHLADDDYRQSDEQSHDLPSCIRELSAKQVPESKRCSGR